MSFYYISPFPSLFTGIRVAYSSATVAKDGARVTKQIHLFVLQAENPSLDCTALLQITCCAVTCPTMAQSTSYLLKQHSHIWLWKALSDYITRMHPQQNKGYNFEYFIAKS